ncbi:MAG: DNA primase [Endomicrobium sp.]|jgi:DNA primase|nr:DNA primase [Endomicrobium sp.]
MAISEDIIEKIRLSNSIESIVQEYLPDLKRIGRNWKACCPFHNENTPSFLVNPEKGIFKCFGCNVGGDVFKFVMLTDNISWYESVRKLAKKANIEIEETKQDIVKTSERAKIFDILENSTMFYHKYLLESAGAEKAREYLKDRGISRETINKFKLGYAPKERILEFALKKGYTTESVQKAGLIKENEKGGFFEYMSERIVFPIFDVQGRIIAFGGRTILDRAPKYLNTPETIVYLKSSNLYGLFQTLPELRRERKIIILEGYIDAIVSQQFGVTGAVATLGTAFNKNHVKLISRYSDAVTLLFDSDDAGRIAAHRALEILVENGVECKVSNLPEHMDADEYLNQYGREEFLNLLESSSNGPIDFMITKVRGDFFSKNGETPETKAKAVYFLLDFITKNSNLVLQREWIKTVAQRMNVDEEILWNEFKKKHKLKFKNYLRHYGDLDLHTVKDRRLSMSLEENFLNIILNNRNYIEKVDCNFFEDVRCRRVFKLATSGLSEAEISDALSKENKGDEDWFSGLVLNAIKYSNIEEAFDIILKEIKTNRLERKRLQLEKEILLMIEGKREKDKRLFCEYKELTSLSKGLGKWNA